MSDPTPDQPSQLRVGSLDYTPGALDTSRLRPEVAEHHQAVAAELIDHAARRVLDILAATMHHADFTYNVTAELVNNIVAFAADPESDWEQLLDKLDRVIEVLEDIRDARRGKNTQRPPTREEIVRFARGGIVKRPEGAGPVVTTYDPERDGTLITAEQARAMPTLDELRERGRLG